MAGTELERLLYRDRFRSFHNEAFQAWFENIERILHPVGDFQSIRKTSGDGGIDGFVINSQVVYQVYAPARMSELRDAETAQKIRADSATAYASLTGQMKRWVFVHNHPEGKLGKLGIAAIADLKTRHPGIEIAVLDINSLWDELQDLPAGALGKLIGDAQTYDMPSGGNPRVGGQALDFSEGSTAAAVCTFERREYRNMDVLGDNVAPAELYQEVPLLLQVKEASGPKSPARTASAEGAAGLIETDPTAILTWEQDRMGRDQPVYKTVGWEQIFHDFRSLFTDGKSSVPRFVVLGPPGSGKTTFFRYLAWLAAAGELNMSGRRLVPAHVRLREWEMRALKPVDPEFGLPEYLANHYKELNPPPSSPEW